MESELRELWRGKSQYFTNPTINLPVSYLCDPMAASAKGHMCQCLLVKFVSSLQLGMSVDLDGDGEAANFPIGMGLHSAERWERGVGEEIV